jgi:STE24 endopeptidase
MAASLSRSGFNARIVMIGTILLALGLATSVWAAPVESNRDVQSAVDAYLNQISPEERARGDAYIEGGYWLQLGQLLLGLAVAGLLLGTGLSRWLRDRCERLTRLSFLQALLYAAVYIVVTFVLFLPLSIYSGFVREQQFGLMNQSFADWLLDQLKGLAISVMLGSVLIAVLYTVGRLSPKRWWLWGAGVAVVFLALVVTIAPVFLEPVFNQSTPLPEGTLRERVLALAHANGIPADDVFVMDESKQSKRISAHVSGLFGTTRISLNDNLLARGTPAEVEAVMAHEMGHYVLSHILVSVFAFGALILVGFAFVNAGFGWVQRRWGARLGIRAVTDVAGLPLMVALISLFFFIATPLTNTIIRTQEAQADIFGLNAARQPDAFASITLKLGEYRKLDPTPLEEWMFFDHPSGRSRITMAMRWKTAHAALDP